MRSSRRKYRTGETDDFVSSVRFIPDPVESWLVGGAPLPRPLSSIREIRGSFQEVTDFVPVGSAPGVELFGLSEPVSVSEVPLDRVRRAQVERTERYGYPPSQLMGNMVSRPLERDLARVCADRKVRREVLMAHGRGGAPGRRSWKSAVSC